MGDIKFVQLEAGDFLSDPDFQLMTAEERGIYCSVIFYMYGNDGIIKDDPSLIKRLCNVNGDFEKSWRNVRNKFVEVSEAQIKRSRRYCDNKDYLTHKRVRKELTKAKKYLQGQRTAGLRGAKKRWGSRSNPNGDPISNPNGYKSKIKENKIKLFPIIGKSCSRDKCKLPAVYRDTSGSYDFYYCKEHLPAAVKEEYEG